MKTLHWLWRCLEGRAFRRQQVEEATSTILNLSVNYWALQIQMIP